IYGGVNGPTYSNQTQVAPFGAAQCASPTPTVTATPPPPCGLYWRTVSSPYNQGATFRAVAVVAANDIWAVGAGGGTLTEHWDGSSWTRVPSPNPGPGNNELYAVAAVATNDIWAVGSSYGGLRQTLIEHWN